MFPNEIDIKIFGENAGKKFEPIAKASMDFYNYKKKGDYYLPGVAELWLNCDKDDFAIFSGYSITSAERTFFNEDKEIGASTLEDIAKSLKVNIAAISVRESDDIFFIYLVNKEGYLIKRTACSLSNCLIKYCHEIENQSDAITYFEDMLYTYLEENIKDDCFLKSGFYDITIMDKDVSKVYNKFTKEQVAQLELGRENHLDINLYMDPNFDAEQMFEIRAGAMKGLDVKIYADTSFNANQMHEIRTALEMVQDKDLIINYVNSKYNWKQLREIFITIEQGFDKEIVKEVASSGSAKEMRRTRRKYSL